MKLKTIEIKKFLANSSMIRSKGILPVLDYLLVKDDVIIKTNLEAFVSMQITPTGETILLDENILSGLVKRTTAEYIDVTIKKDVVYLNDGVYKPYFTLSPADVYPKFPDSEIDNETRLNENVLKAIGAAYKNLGTGGDAFDFVHLAYGYVFAADHFKFYFRKFDGLPTITMSSLCAGIISQFGAVSHYKVGNFDFYSVGSLLYGFKMQEVKTPDFTMFLNFISKEEYMEVNVSEIVDFLDFLSGSTSSLTTTCDFDGKKLSFNDVDLSVGNEVELDIVGDYKMKKSFLPRIVSPFLKSIGKEKVRFSPMLSGRKGITVWVEDEPDLIGMLGEATTGN